MSVLKNIVIAMIYLYLSITVAQITEGKVIYKVSLNNESYLEKVKKESKLNEKSKKMVIENMSNTTPVNFFLFFKGNESIYRSEYDLDEQRDMEMEWNETSVLAGEADITYFNLKTKQLFRQNFFINKILTSVDPIVWNLSQKTKQIGEYTCYLATGILKEYKETGGRQSSPITAWYTPQIPLPFGIQNFTGLPGLTLELTHQTEEGTLYYKAVEIELKPKNKIIIKKPKGKIITQKEYIELIKNYGRR